MAKKKVNQKKHELDDDDELDMSLEAGEFSKVKGYIHSLRLQITTLKGQLTKSRKKRCKHHPIEIRDSMEVRAEMRAQDSIVKHEGHWQG